ncbi:conserved hypothetical protein [Xanthomonas citri pv. fuscans]|nr:conserved hypothetical protein [Xanthomonas citri pv. fuscans]SOO00633.1 conserved hypothetical protein [Xanthomonas citri pv. fuscans]SOO01361.1 conserved hypothetical protein [Xanthomonas citri pv. fuscans]SOO09925.1 conserved hypothetical protein [Xanthomonas citri pv. fuscans]SOO13901.1 conserved hypothetical protein [Xanthomonas citri pv. fuscans]
MRVPATQWPGVGYQSGHGRAGWLRRRKSLVALGDVLNNFGQWPVLLTRMAGSALADPAHTRRPGLGPAAVKLPAPSSCRPA